MPMAIDASPTCTLDLIMWLGGAAAIDRPQAPPETV